MQSNKSAYTVVCGWKLMKGGNADWNLVIQAILPGWFEFLFRPLMAVSEEDGWGQCTSGLLEVFSCELRKYTLNLKLFTSYDHPADLINNTGQKEKPKQLDSELLLS